MKSITPCRESVAFFDQCAWGHVEESQVFCLADNDAVIKLTEVVRTSDLNPWPGSDGLRLLFQCYIVSCKFAQGPC